MKEKNMKCAVTDGKGKVWLEEVPIPEYGEYQMLCKNIVCTTCTGTDKKHVHNRMTGRLEDYPGILGHENLGEVVACGKKVRNFKVGDLVLRPTCVYPAHHYMGYYSLWGAFSEYGIVTDEAAWREDDPAAEISGYCRYQLKVPSCRGMAPADLVQLITLKEVAGFAIHAGCRFADRVLVLGAGSVAYFFCRALKLIGASPVIVAARRDAPLRTAVMSGADFTVNISNTDIASEVMRLTGGRGVNAVFDTTGSSEMVNSALGTLAENGKCWLYAVWKEEEKAKLKHGPISKTTTGEVETHEAFCRLLERGAIDMKGLYSHRLPFRMISDGFELIERKEAWKIVFDF